MEHNEWQAVIRGLSTYTRVWKTSNKYSKDAPECPRKTRISNSQKKLGGKRELKSRMNLMKLKAKKHKISTNERLGSLKGLIQTSLYTNEPEERRRKHPK